MQKTGVLFFDPQDDRFDIQYDGGGNYGGLHCGDCFEVFADGAWQQTRMEYSDDWYLVGIKTECLNGLQVRLP